MLSLGDERLRRAERRAGPRRAVERQFAAAAVLGQGAHRARLGSANAQLDLLARSERERQRRGEVERQLAHHHARFDSRLLTEEEVVSELGVQALHAQLDRGPRRLDRHRRRPLGGELDLGDSGLDRLQKEDVVARIELPFGRRAAHGRRLPALRIGVDEQRFEAELRRRAARLQAIGASLLDLDVERRCVEQVEAPRPAGDAGEHHGLAGDDLALLLRATALADQDRGRFDRIGDRTGVHGRDPVLRLGRAGVELTLPGAGEMLQDVGLAGDTADRHDRRMVGVGEGAELGDRWHVLLGDRRRRPADGEGIPLVEGDQLEIDGSFTYGGRRQLEAVVVGGTRDEHAVETERTDRPPFAQRLGVARPAETQVERPFDATRRPPHLRAAVGGQTVEAGGEVGGQLAELQRSAALRLDDAHRRRGVDQPGAVLPEPEVGEISPRGLEDHASPLRNLEPPGELFEVGELAVERLALDQLHRRRRDVRGGIESAFAKRHHRERRLAGRELAAVGQDSHLAAVEEEIDPAVLLAGLARDLAGARHPVHDLQRGATRARHSNRGAPEVGDLDEGGLAAGSRYDRRLEADRCRLAGGGGFGRFRLSAERGGEQSGTEQCPSRPRAASKNSSELTHESLTCR